MIINNLFSVPIVFFDISDDIIKKTLSRVNTFIDEKTDWRSKTILGETFTTYHIEKNFLGKIECVDLLNEINENVRHFLELIGKDPTIGLEIDTWVNFNPPGTGHQMHEHFGSLASGVIYLEAGNDSGDLVFYDPINLRTQSNSHNPGLIYKKNDFNFTNYRLKPQTNRMVIFEGWLYHSVDYNKTDKNRISISFNVGELRGEN